MTESARKNVSGALIANYVEYLRSEILMYGGTPRTPHTIGPKQLNLGFFSPHVCGLSHFEDLIRF